MPKALQIHRYGPPAVFELAEVDLPPVPAGEVRFRVLAAAVNRADVEIRRGQWPIVRPDPFPYTPGLEALGDVAAVGLGVTDVAVGDRVITMMQKLGGIWGERPGGYQEFVTVEAARVAIVPPDLDPLAVAALGLTAVTALAGLRRLALQPGERLVITGASGGVGSCAVAMARALGAQIIATSTGSGKDDYLRRLGVAKIVHLDTTTLSAALGARSVDAVLETLGERTFADSVAVLRRGGRLCLLGALTGEHLRLSAWDLLQDLRLTGYSSENLTGDDLRDDLAQITTWLRSGQIAPPVYQTFPLSQAAEVHSLMERNVLAGRALLVP